VLLNVSAGVTNELPAKGFDTFALHSSDTGLDSLSALNNSRNKWHHKPSLKIDAFQRPRRQQGQEHPPTATFC
jgi:hypothetical protein